MWRITVTILLVAESAAAQHSYRVHMDHVNRSPHTEESRVLLGIKGSYASVHEGEREQGGGAGIFAETTLIHGWLELELSAQLLRIGGEAWEVPIDLLLKKPFCFGDFIQAYVGIGPAVAVVVAESERETLVGGLIAVGAYLWVTPRFGWDVEVNYAVFGRAQEPVHDITVSVGPAFRI
ncbi:MAG: hypothetical protein AAGE52_18660 [Myxococcota bacterium]